MTREQPPVAHFAHKPESDKECAGCGTGAAPRSSNQKRFNAALQINYSINDFGRTRCVGQRRSLTGGAHREQRSSGRKVAVRTTWAEAKAKVGAAKNLPSTFRALSFTVPRPVETRALKIAGSTRAIKFTLAVSLLAASAIGWVYWLIAANSRKQTPCRIAGRYDNNKANNNCGRVIAINLVLGAWNQSFLKTGLYAHSWSSRLDRCNLADRRRIASSIFVHFSWPTLTTVLKYY